MNQAHYYVYILTNKRHGTLYTGVTNDLVRRIIEHKSGTVDGFSKQHELDKLVYYEVTSDVEAALHREKIIKKWKRSFKCNAIYSMNPEWKDLYEDIIK